MHWVDVSISDAFTFTRHAMYWYESCPEQACDLTALCTQ